MHVCVCKTVMCILYQMQNIKNKLIILLCHNHAMSGGGGGGGVVVFFFWREGPKDEE